ncbi:MAG: hypothetical protein N2653_02815 [Burkholderiales bacterium]|nr:hypothetical protein [Burkholderiales bacterium]
MKFAFAIALALPLGAAAHSDKKDDAHIRQTIAQHRTLAAAHEAAARCLEAGKPEKECHAQLARDCKGAGIGKYCGLRHKH